jgi:ubiquinone/menaquinone biosynthesis C-methylase UbiE
VNDDLWAEHLARYAYATRLSKGARVLDIGCGAGYGTATLAQHALAATGIDVSADAVEFARAHYPLPNLTFLGASATALPFPSASFDVITAFEVIEHLDNWHDLLIEARRLLRPSGVFLVSTPNKSYYAESRAETGPNPFHSHEFEYAEFRDALAAVFPHVSILLQNRLESQAFYPHATFNPVDAQMDSARGSAEEAHFYLALCSIDCAVEPRSFLYVPRAANLLREREEHIRLLNEELGKNKGWLAQVTGERQQLMAANAGLERELQERNEWGLKLGRDLDAAMQRVADLQDMVQAEQAKAIEMAAAYQRTVDSLELENRQKTEWALDTEKRLSAALAQKCDELAETVRLLDRAEATVVERTAWAQDLDARLGAARAQLKMSADSRWVRLGRAVGLGPRISGDAG